MQRSSIPVSNEPKVSIRTGEGIRSSLEVFSTKSILTTAVPANAPDVTTIAEAAAIGALLIVAP